MANYLCKNISAKTYPLAKVHPLADDDDDGQINRQTTTVL